ncbi:hypothetical protein BDZ94DRAFT_1277152 [Collybia nuda]|uniref:Uncharacterized protein n=1 Tax=Collybia nuda TaxID=64659 RepID=A0A9P6CCA3_9AGAR|nr:hypothetical protein BDZ94DRAFT_1277152 [Collybia nuda]
MVTYVIKSRYNLFQLHLVKMNGQLVECIIIQSKTHQSLSFLSSFEHHDGPFVNIQFIQIQEVPNLIIHIFDYSCIFFMVDGMIEYTQTQFLFNFRQKTSEVAFKLLETISQHRWNF